jgi:hypothetical protein
MGKKNASTSVSIPAGGCHLLRGEQAGQMAPGFIFGRWYNIMKLSK